ncbi:MAG TPA: helix-turn-helix domain-containing protein [Gemmatimonadales bacterium]|nr:helix-turn-helix domain-containing protein [Gemmatimonadales bacterium]
MDYRETEAPPDLGGIVRCTWRLVGEADSSAEIDPEPALPDGSPELIVSRADPFEHVASGGAVTRQPAAFLVGQITGPMLVRPTGRADLVVVRFESHAAAMLQRPMSRITDTWLDVETSPGLLRLGLAAALRERCMTDDPEAAILDWLRDLIRKAPPADPTVATAVRTIRSSHGMVELARLCAELGIHPRTLQRRFLTEVGILPKQLARIVRFQRVFSAWRSDPSSLARVAAGCGYYDQSHLTRDFRELAGAAPAGFLAAVPEFTGFFLPEGENR